jgi:DNA-directed RNA polymerase specialized sigma24 family protein
VGCWSYADHHARILRWLTYQTRGNTVLAEDLAPEMFVAAMRYAHTYRGTGTVGLWLTKIAQRQLHEHALNRPGDSGDSGS